MNCTCEASIELAYRMNFALGNAVMCIASRKNQEKEKLESAIQWLKTYQDHILAIDYHTSPIAAQGKQKSEAIKLLHEIFTKSSDEFLKDFLKSLIYCYGVRINTIERTIKLLNKHLEEIH